MPQEWGTLLKRKPTKHTLLRSFTALYLLNFYDKHKGDD